jgi:hypothetical protein
MSHHKNIYTYIQGEQVKVGHVRITNTGTIMSVWISNDVQQMLFLPEHPELVQGERMMCPNCLERIVITTTWYEVKIHFGLDTNATTKVCSWQCMLEWFAD